MTRKFVFLFVATLLLCGCSASISSSSLKSYSPTPYSQNIDVYNQYDIIQKETELVGTIEYDDTGFSLNCDYSNMISSFIEEARKMGGDAVKIVTMKEPDRRSTCYRGSANVLKYHKKVRENKSWNKPVEKNKPQMQRKVEPLSRSNPRKANSNIFVAILETFSGGNIGLNESQYLTNVLREEAVKVLPSGLNYTIMTRENILTMLPPDKAIENCEGSCLVETGRNISANYVAQARISTFGSNLTISVELYNSSNGKLIASFNAKSPDVENLEVEIRQKAPSMFKEVLQLESF